jgi:acyl-CoA reductase-like NAD-dependent aldehyde dehydrogenase
MSPVPAAGPGTSQPPADLPGDEQFARNLIGGRWQLPAMPFDVEVRSPRDGSVLAAVPLSSRIDVARAVTAARSAAGDWSADRAGRRLLVGRLAGEIGRCAGPLAGLMELETGLNAADCRTAVQDVSRLCQVLLAGDRLRPRVREPAGASAHILSWGLPLAEVTCAVLPHLLAGRTAVIKPSLRGPLSAAAFGYLATGLGFPPGVINIVQGTGVDAGAALAGAPGLAALHVRAGERTLAQADRAATAARIRLAGLRGGGNVAVIGPDGSVAAAAAVAGALRLHSAGGVAFLPLVFVHEQAERLVTEAILDRLASCQPAPLPTHALRERAVRRAAGLRARGARLLRGGTVPDDARHRMGWIIPPTVLAGGPAGTGPGRALPAGEPLGPVLTILTWRTPADIAGALSHARYADGIACAWGLTDDDLAAAALPQAAVLHEAAPITALGSGCLPAAWTGGYPAGPPAGPGAG